MTEASPVGMVDDLPGYGGASPDDLAFARAYLAEGPMDPTLTARLTNPDRLAERERVKAGRRTDDWAALGHYRQADAALAGQAVEAVLMGDSITEMWPVAQPDLFTDGVVGRGISGQTSAQMLLRFMPDVIALKPRIVHLMCGVNDIAGNTGPTTPGDYLANVEAMLDLARANGVIAILASMTPVTALAWTPSVSDPRGRVVELNQRLRQSAERRGLVFADHFAALSDGDDALRADLTRDGVHPTAAGYARMRPVLERALAAARRG